MELEKDTEWGNSGSETQTLYPLSYVFLASEVETSAFKLEEARKELRNGEALRAEDSKGQGLWK